MVKQCLTPFAPRPRGAIVAIACVLAPLGTSGCNHHRRAALRPVLVTPAPAAGCTTPGCTTGSSVGTPGATLSAPSSSSVVEPSMPSVVEPSASTLGAPAEPAPSSSPSLERLPSATPGPPPSGSGPGASRPGSGEEPSLLEPAPSSGNSSGEAPAGTRSGGAQAPQSPSSLTVPRLPAPGTSLRGARRNLSTQRLGSPLREKLMGLTNNPDDLFAPPRADRPWKYVVLHHSAHATGSYGEIDQEHRTRLGWEGCGYHFVIGNGTGSPDGQIEVAQRWTDQKQGIHCRNGKNPEVSEYGIGICLVGNLDDAPPTPRQIEAAQTLVAYLGARYRIPADHIGTHAQLASNPTACPGKYFPTQTVLGARSPLVQR